MAKRFLQEGSCQKKVTNTEVSSFTSKKQKKEDLTKDLKDKSVLAIYEIEFLSPTAMKSFKRIHNQSDLRGKGKILKFKGSVIAKNN